MLYYILCGRQIANSGSLLVTQVYMKGRQGEPGGLKHVDLFMTKVSIAFEEENK